MKKILITLSLLLFAGIQLADAQKRWHEIEYPEINNFEMPEIEMFELDNGIKFYLVEDRELPLINVNVRVRTGSVLDDEAITGRASIAGTVMRSGGSEAYPDDELNELLENRAARMETGIGRTSGTANMNVLKEDFESLLPVFIDLLKNPLFPEDKIDLAKTQTKTAISRRNDEQGPIASREFRKLIYGENSVYARHTEYETIDNITRDDLTEFHEMSFVGNNLYVGVIGDFDKGDMIDLISDHFSEIPAGEPLDLHFPEVDYEFEESIHFVNKTDVNQSYVLLGHIGGMRDNPDYAKLQVMNQVLSGGFSSRLFQVVRSDMGLAYSVFGSYGSNSFYPGTFTAGVMTQSETTAEAIDAVIEQIERLQDELVTDEELQQTKDQFLNSLVFRYDSRSKILNERISNDYAGLEPDTFDRLVEEIREVTPEDIKEVANEYLRPDALKILVVGNAEEIGDQLEKYGEINEIDITIPQPGDEDEITAGDKAAGKEWIDSMAAAVLPGGSIDGELVMEAEVTAQTPQGEMTMDINQTTDFEKENMVFEINMPMGQITQQIIDGEGKMMMGGNEMPMQPQQKEQLMAGFYRSHWYLALNKEQLDVEYLGMEEMEGTELAAIRVNDEMPLTLFINPDTSLPVVTTYRQFNPQMGQRVTVKTVTNDWRENNGVMVPYETIEYAADEQSSVTVVKSHTVQ